MMKTALLIFLGGGLGSAARYFLGGWISRLSGSGSGASAVAQFPLGTLTVNIVACLLVGLLAGLVDQRTSAPIMRAFLIIGFCGGFSTFSTFSMESVEMIANNLTGHLILYILLSVGCCVGATLGGMWVAARLT